MIHTRYENVSRSTIHWQSHVRIGFLFTGSFAAQAAVVLETFVDSCDFLLWRLPRCLHDRLRVFSYLNVASPGLVIDDVVSVLARQTRIFG